MLPECSPIESFMKLTRTSQLENRDIVPHAAPFILFLPHTCSAAPTLPHLCPLVTTFAVACISFSPDTRSVASILSHFCPVVLTSCWHAYNFPRVEKAPLHSILPPSCTRDAAPQCGYTMEQRSGNIGDIMKHFNK